MKIKPIPTYTVVHTPTEEEAKELLGILHENGYKWFDGSNLTNTLWGVCKDETCYQMGLNMVIYADVEGFDGTAIILTLAEFKERYCEEEKPQPKFVKGQRVYCRPYGYSFVISEVVVYDDNEPHYYSENGGCYKESILEPYTEPEAKDTKDDTIELNPETFTDDCKSSVKVEEKSRPKFEVGDMAFFPKRDKPMRIHDIKEGVAMSWWNNGGIRAAACLENLRPYTEPDTNLPKSVGLKTERKPTEDMETKEEKSENPINLCELLQGHEGETFYSLAIGECTLTEITTSDTYPIKLNHSHYSADGKFDLSGEQVVFPSRALYEQYPLDAAKAWMKWQEEQKKYALSIAYVGNGIEIENVVMTFFKDSDRNKCLSEIKAIIEKYSK